MVNENIAMEKSKRFAIRIVNMYKYLCAEKKEYILSKQVLRSGTSIGANIREANYAQGKKDFVSKLQIALKECYETEYWIELFVKADVLDRDVAKDLYNQCGTIRRLLIASINTAKDNMK